MAAVAFFAAPAFAADVTWSGNGSQNLPCSGNEHWILAGNVNVTSAQLLYNGVVVATFSQHGQGSWSANTNIGVTSADIGHVSASGEWTGSPVLTLSDCDTEVSTTEGPTTEGPTTEGPTTEGPTTEGPTTEGPTTEGPTTEGPTTEGPTTEGPGTTAGPSGGVSGATTGGTGAVSGGTTGGTAAAPAGGNLPFTGLPVWIPLLAAAALLASGVVLIRRKKGETS
jgi:hypothetical protein